MRRNLFVGVMVAALCMPAAAFASGNHVFDRDQAGAGGNADFWIARADGGPAAGGGTNTSVWIATQTGATERLDFGKSTDTFLTGDFDGDGKDDPTVWSPGAAGVAGFTIRLSTTGTDIFRLFGQTGDDPAVIGDWNGDGVDDLAVYRAGATGAQSYFYWAGVNTATTVNYVPWGLGGDFPYVLDYDGDGRVDPAVQRGSVHWIRESSGPVAQITYGLANDFIAPGDYDGDGRDDIALSRTVSGQKNFYIRESDGGGSPGTPVQWGLTGDSIAPADYDNDGKTDIAIWRPSQGAFWVRYAAGGTAFKLWGKSGDFALNSWNVH